MTTPCCFCAHGNPDGAKFCNECASPLHLAPCRACEAVNVREADSCYRCGAALVIPRAAVVAEAPDSPSETIVAQAGETLAALRRELMGSAAPLAAATGTVVSAAGSADAAAPPAAADGEALVATPPWTAEERPLYGTAQPAAPEPAWRPAEPEHEPEIAAALPAATVTPQSGDEALRVETTSVSLDPGEREWQPRRRSRSAAIVLAIAAIGIPLAVYLLRHPEVFDRRTDDAGSTAATTAPAASPAAGDAATAVNPTANAPDPANAGTAQLPAVPGPAAGGTRSAAPAAADTSASAPATATPPRDAPATGALPSDAATAARASQAPPQAGQAPASAEAAGTAPSAPAGEVRAAPESRAAAPASAPAGSARSTQRAAPAKGTARSRSNERTRPARAAPAPQRTTEATTPSPVAAASQTAATSPPATSPRGPADASAPAAAARESPPGGASATVAREIAPAPTRRTEPCTEAIAALGLCTPSRGTP